MQPQQTIKPVFNIKSENIVYVNSGNSSANTFTMSALDTKIMLTQLEYIVGPIGNTGPVGLTGAQGIPGSATLTGATGSPGPAGIAGPLSTRSYYVSTDAVYTGSTNCAFICNTIDPIYTRGDIDFYYDTNNGTITNISTYPICVVMEFQIKAVSGSWNIYIQDTGDNNILWNSNINNIDSINSYTHMCVIQPRQTIKPIFNIKLENIVYINWGYSSSNTFTMSARDTKIQITQLEYVIGPTGVLGPTGPIGPITWDTINTSNIYYNNGNVAIGQNKSPQYTLDISGDLKISNNTITNKTINNLFVDGVVAIDASNLAIDFNYGSNYFISNVVWSTIRQNYTLSIRNINTNITNISNSNIQINIMYNFYTASGNFFYANKVNINGIVYTPQIFQGVVNSPTRDSTVNQSYSIFIMSGVVKVLTNISYYS